MSVLEANGPVKYAKIDVSASGDTNIVNPVPGSRIRVLALALIPDGAVSITFKSGSTALTGPVRVSSELMLAAETSWGCFECESGQPLSLNLSSAVQVSGWLSYQEIK